MDKQEIQKAIFRLWDNNYTLQKLKNIGAPPDIIKWCEKSVQSVRDQIADLGVDPDEEIKRHWLQLTEREMESDRYEKCLVRLRASQVRQRANERDRQNICNMECFLWNEGIIRNCLECSAYQEATHEQMANYYHCCDIDTGQVDPLIWKTYHDE